VDFQGEDGIRGRDVTGVQTCALPVLLVAISWLLKMTAWRVRLQRSVTHISVLHCRLSPASVFPLRIWIQYLRKLRRSTLSSRVRSEERRVGKKRWTKREST